MADNVEIQGLEFKIANDSTQAVTGLQNLINTLNRLKTATKGGAPGLSKTAQGIQEISNSLNNGDVSQKITRLANALTILSQVGKTKISSSIANQLNSISKSVANLQWTDGDKLTALADGLRPLSELGKSKMTTFINQLGKLPKVINELEAADIDKFTRQMKDLSAAMKPFADEMQKVSNGFSAFPARIQKLVSSFNSYDEAVRKSTSSTSKFGNGLKALNIAGVALLFKRVSGLIGKMINASNQYVEDMNLFTVAMGDYAQRAREYAETVSNAVGIDSGAWMRNQGVFMTLADGFGVASDRAYTMSQNLTQLGYDISSFFNIPIDEAMQKVQSGLAGELEPLRRIGYDLSVARLQEEAYALGIDKKVSAMNQAEKAELRYYAMLTQVTKAQGDMARTLDAPANQLRVLQAQLQMAARAIGDLFIPALNAILPYCIAVVRAIREVAAALGALGGASTKSPSVLKSVASNTQKVSRYADDTADGYKAALKAAKNLMNYTMGIDELNIISPPVESGGSGGSGGAGSVDDIIGDGFDFDLPTYDFLEGLVESRVDELMAKWKPAIEWIKKNLTLIKGLAEAIGAAILAWKITSSFTNDLSKLFGLSMVAAGVTLGISNINAIIDGEYDFLSLRGTLQAAISGAVVAAGFSLAAVGAGASAGLFAIAIPIGAVLGVVITDIVVNWDGYKSLAETFIDGIKALFEGDVVGVGEALDEWFVQLGKMDDSLLNFNIRSIVDTLFGEGTFWDTTFEIGNGRGSFVDVLNGLVEDYDDFWDNMSVSGSIGASTVSSVTAASFGVLSGIVKEALGPLPGWVSSYVIEPIKNRWKPVTDWVDKNVISPTKRNWTEFFNKLPEWASSAWEEMKRVWGVVSDWWKQHVNSPIETATKWVWQHIKGFFTDPIKEIKSNWNAVVDWFRTHVVEPLKNMFNFEWSLPSIKLPHFSITGKFSLSPLSVPSISVDWYKHGGFPDEGELFIARESGPELVGQMGRRNAVANNDQIVEGISEGVAEANQSVVNAIYQMARDVINAIESNQPLVSISDDTIGRSAKRFEQRTGTNPTKGVFAYVR